MTRSRHKDPAPPGGESAAAGGEAPDESGARRDPGAGEKTGEVEPGRARDGAPSRPGGDGDADPADLRWTEEEVEEDGEGEVEEGGEDEVEEDGEEDREEGGEEDIEDDATWPGDPRTGWLLLAAGLMAWLGWGLIRWSPPGGVPAAAVTADAAGDDGEPTAAGAAADEPARPAAADPGAAEEVPPEAADSTAADGSADEAGEPEPWRPDPEWAKDLTPPDVVRYKIRNGGTLVNVANLYKIFHHEIQALNPGVPLEKELPPGSEVVVYRREKAKPGRSIGYAGKGRLEGAVPMPDGPGRILKMIPWKSWATPQTIALIDGVLRQWAGRYPDAMPILVGNLSAPTGGRLPPHSSHQSGRDVDLGYPQKPGVEKEYNWREMDARNLDAARTWDLLELLAETGAIEAVFMDRKIQKLLYDHAVEHESKSRSELRRWLEYPRPTGSGRPLVRHVKGHVDHLHVRVACAPADAECKTR